jgi:uncharacterized protein (TIGR03435 family)
MSKTTTLILIVVLVVVLVLAFGVKILFFPSVKDIYFATTQPALLRVPAGLAVIRPTHVPHHRESVIYANPQKGSGDPSWRMSGRNVPLQDLIATAYGETRGRVVMPDNAPTNAYDFIVTTRDPRASLQKAIHDKLHYTGDWQTNDTDVLAMKIADPSLPGMTPSAPGEKRSPSVKNGKLTLYHMQIKDVTHPFEQFLKTPVVDETGLTNYYDATLVWNSSMGPRLGNPSTARPLVDKILQGWGLALEPDTASIQVLVVKKVY